MIQAWRRLWQRVRRDSPSVPSGPPPRGPEPPSPAYADKAPQAGRDYETKGR